MHNCLGLHYTMLLIDCFCQTQVSGSPMTSKCNKHKIWFPRDENWNIDVKRGKYDTKINRKRQPLSMNKRGYSALV